MTQNVSLSGRESLTGPVAPEITGGIVGSGTAARLADEESGTDDPFQIGIGDSSIKDTGGPSAENRSEHERMCDYHGGDPCDDDADYRHLRDRHREHDRGRRD